jgi:tetratricopeptide (TPR) repeat protein
MSAPDSDPLPPDGGSPKESDDAFPPRWQAAWRWGAPGLTLAALLLLAWNCAFNPEIRFLMPGSGQWIVYPLPATARNFPGFELVGTFRRCFVLPEKPPAALLSWRAMTNGEVRLNNVLIPPAAASSGNWKSTSQTEVGRFLRQGSNEISVTVMNRSGPPALSLELKAGSFRLASDESWEVSVSGSDWRAAQAASETPKAGKGNDLSLLETTNGAWQRCWPWLCVFTAISVCGVALWQFYIGRIRSSGSGSTVSKAILALLAAAWTVLFLHNFPLIPPAAGFDGPLHLEYARFIQDHRRLPSADQGREMFQAPLYYVISAKLLELVGRNGYELSGLMVLRFLSLAIGAANLALIFAGLRLLFPGDWKKPLAGLLLAAFLPAHLFLLHYTTNETLAAMFVTASLCVGLHLLRLGKPWRGWYGVLGIVLGLALLSKASAVLVVPVILGALALKLGLCRERRIGVWLGCIGAPLLLCLLVGGWYYLRLWRDYGSPFIGNWDPKLGTSWWQAKGFQTPGYFFAFGDSLTRPFFSGLHSFWDGLYSTLWGDGLVSGRNNVWSRSPWNYDFMAVGFILALFPTALVLTGLVRALAGCFRAAHPAWLLLLGCGWLFAFAILAMCLRVPSYAQTKAFYAIPVLLPFGALGALGFEFWADRGKVTRYVLEAALGLWLLNVYASFWIKPHAIQTELASAIAASACLKGDSTEPYLHFLKRHADNSAAIIRLASLESGKNPDQAVKRLEQALKKNPANGGIEAFLARNLALCGRLDEAVAHARRAVELAPEDEIASKTWCMLSLRRKDYEEAVTAGREALSLDPTDLAVQGNLGVALMNLRQFPEATSHFSAVADAKPTWAEMQFCLGLCLLHQPGKRDEGLDHLKEAARLNPANAAWQTALQNALKDNGGWP